MAEEKPDFLEVDEPIGGQNFCLLSFVEPEDIIQNKEAFKTAKFLQSIAKEQDKDFKKFYEHYLDFQYKYHDDIERDFVKENTLKTNIRGLKVRGVYSSKEEADAKALRLQKKDSSFHVFVGQVGYWLPFNPIADKIEDEKFINDGLQELMEGYKQNAVNKDILYEEDKRDKLKRAAEELAKAKEEEEKNKQEELEKAKLADAESGENSVSEVVEEEQTEEQTEEQEQEQVEEQTEEQVEETASLDSSLKDTLQEVDPWLKNKVESVSISESDPESTDPVSEDDPKV